MGGRGNGEEEEKWEVIKSGRNSGNKKKLLDRRERRLR